MILELQNVNTNKLHDELINKGITPYLVQSSENITYITIDDALESKVMEIVALHNPTPIQSPKSEIDELKEMIALLSAEIQALKQSP